MDKTFNEQRARSMVDMLAHLDVLDSAMVGMYEDWWWTAKTWWEDGAYCEDVHIIPASHWASPCILIHYKDGSVRCFECWDGPVPEDIMDHQIHTANQQALWTSGVLSGPMQDNMPELESWPAIPETISSSVKQIT